MAPPKKKAEPVTSAMVTKASNSTIVKDLICLATAFTRAGIKGPFEFVLPVLTSVSVKDKGYRRHNVPMGTLVNAGEIKIGKRDGLIFIMPVVNDWVCDKGPVEWVELGWDDLVNCFDYFPDMILESYLAAGATERNIAMLNNNVRGAINTNAGMHRVLNEGFAIAQTRKRNVALQDDMQDNPLFGQF